MKKYEIMFIVRPTISEDELKKTVENCSNILTSNGAKITEVKEMGQREFAYEMKKFKSGYYYLINLESNDDKAINEFDRLSFINNDIIRHLITKVED